MALKLNVWNITNRLFMIVNSTKMDENAERENTEREKNDQEYKCERYQD